MTVLLELGRVVLESVCDIVNVLNGAYHWCSMVSIMYHTKHVWQGDGICICQSYRNSTKHLEDMNIRQYQ